MPGRGFHPAADKAHNLVAPPYFCQSDFYRPAGMTRQDTPVMSGRRADYSSPVIPAAAASTSQASRPLAGLIS
jgi:hypothetical protein